MLGKPLALIAAAGCAAIALSACDSTLRIAPSFPPATTTPPPAAPSAAPSAVPVAESEWAAIDWKSVAVKELGCAGPKVDGPHYADLNGNGMSEAVVVASCPTATSVRIFVYEDAETRRPMKRLLTVGEGQDLRTAKVKMKGSTLTITSGTGTLRYTWNGTKFRLR